MKKSMLFVVILIMAILMSPVNFAQASADKVSVKDEQNKVIDVNELTPYMNYRKTNFVILKEKMNKPRIFPIIEIATSLLYGHARPYRQVNSKSINCYGYSVVIPWWMNPGDGDGISNIQNQAAIDNYFKHVNVVAQAVIADGETNQLYFKGSKAPTTYAKWRILTSRTAPINAEEHRIALRVGWHDFNSNGHVDLNGNEADYHFMVQTNTGGWAEKHGQQPSINDGTINPSTFSWDLGSYKGFYNSTTVYLAVRVY